MSDVIRAPWTPDQVAALNEFQRRGGVHPFTCGGDHTPGSPILVAREDGWHCPEPYGEPCDYTQDWAHAFMADQMKWFGSFPPPAATSETSHQITYDASNLDGHLTVPSSAIQAVEIAQPPIITVMGSGGRPLVTVHPDGRLEYGDDYEPDEAARRFWDGVEQTARTIQYGAPLNATINEHLAAGEDAQQRLKAVTEAVTLWRDRPGGDVGLAIALASILDTTQPEPPASAALVRVLRECDRIERAVRDTPQAPDFDGAYLAAIKHIRAAAKGEPSEGDGQ